MSPGTSAGSRTIVQFVQQGKTIDAVALGAPTAISADLDEIAVEVPQSVIAGIADIRVVRLDRVVALGDCSGTFTTVEKAFASNALRLPVEGNYVLSALRITNEVAVLTQGNPFAANPPAELDLVARIPVAPLPRATSVTKDHTRAYVTYSGDATVAAGVTVIDLVSLQEVDAQPGNAPSLGAADPLDRITLPPGARPGQIVLDAANRYAYVADEGRGAVYVIDIDPKSPDFHKSSAVRTIVLPEAETLQGLRGIAIGEDGKRLYVAAPNRVSYSREFRAFSSVFVINVDSADRPENPAENPKKYWEQIAEISMDEPGKTLPGQETFALSNTGDPKRIAFTNRYNDTSGFGLIDITNDAVDGFAANVHSIGLALGASGDTFDVNNGVSLAFLPADAFKEVIGPHPAYAFVGAYNRYITGDPSHDPDAFTESTGFNTPPPAGSNIGLIRDPFSAGAKLVAATTPIPIGVIDNLAFASGYNYLFAGYRGVQVQGAGQGAIMAYYLVNMIDTVEKTLAAAPEIASRLERLPIERLFDGGILPLQEDLGLLNTLIDIKADYRIIKAEPNRGRFTFGIPYLMDGVGNYLVDGAGNKIPSPSAPFGTGGLAQGLSAHVTEVGPGPKIWNQFDLGRGIGIADREDMGISDILREVAGKPQDCNDAKFNSVVQMDSGAVVERHDLVTYQSLGKDQQLSLTYDSITADASPIINFGWEDVGAEIAAYIADPAAELVGGDALLEARITFTGSGGSLSGPLQYWRIPAGMDDFSVAVQTDLSELASGYYNYTVQATFAGKERSTSGTILHINGKESVFGRGWGIMGLQDLYIDPDGSATIMDGSGDGQHFDRVELPVGTLMDCPPPAGTRPEQYVTMNGDDSSFVHRDDGHYQRTMDDGSIYEYSPPTELPDGTKVPGKLIKVTDRYGNETNYAYNAAGHILSITDPVGLVTRFEYSGDRVSRIVDPAGRSTSLTYSGTDLTRIQDPDASARTFGYDAKGRMTSETNKLGGVETNVFDDFGRAKEAHRLDGTVIEVTPWQVLALRDPAQLADKATAPEVVGEKMKDFKARYTLANGNVREVTLTEKGLTLEETDALGLVEALRARRRRLRHPIRARRRVDREHLRQPRQPTVLPRRRLRGGRVDGDDVRGEVRPDHQHYGRARSHHALCLRQPRRQHADDASRRQHHVVCVSAAGHAQVQHRRPRPDDELRVRQRWPAGDGDAPRRGDAQLYVRRGGQHVVHAGRAGPHHALHL